MAPITPTAWSNSFCPQPLWKANYTLYKYTAYKTPKSPAFWQEKASDDLTLVRRSDDIFIAKADGHHCD